jgi:formate hydrogenlyase subunit 7
MTVPLDKTLDAVPRPRVVVACGDCALGGGPFSGGYGVADSQEALAAPDVAIPGCPPDPAAITQALRTLTGR